VRPLAVERRQEGPMSSSRDKILFWCLIATEGAGSQAILWSGLPIYRRLSQGREGAGPKAFVLATIVVIVMQAAHWNAFRLRPRLRFRRNLFLGHTLVFIGELSLFFINALAVVILLDRSAELEFVPWKVLILVAILFAICTYKYQLGKLGDSIIDGSSDVAATVRSNSSSTPTEGTRP
jgi:Na+-transporting NADH:ubiquinone oxidoreductase subunit NqrB